MLYALILFLMVCLAIYWGSMEWIKINRYSVYYNELPQFLEGYKILHFSDLHGNSSKKMNVGIWPEIEKLDFDIAVITGDIIIDNINELTPHLEGFRNLSKRVPTYFVEGNHDRKYLKQIIKIFDEMGIKTLLNESVLFSPNGEKNEAFEIIGVRDLYSQKNQSYKSVSYLFENSDGKFRLVLSHQPQIYNLINHDKKLLVLSGHTHGGQIRLPFIKTMYAPGQGIFPKYGYGFYGDNDSKMYVSKGIGTTVFPVRFWNRPEISVIELKKFH